MQTFPFRRRSCGGRFTCDDDIILSFNETISIRNTKERKLNGCVCVLQNNGAQQLASEATVYIMLEDVNDEIPLFTEREQETVLEGEPIGTKVTQVNAIDKDGTFPNNQVSFFSVCPDSIGTESSPNRKEKCPCRRSGPQPNRLLGSLDS